MDDRQGFSYQIFETYYKQANAAMDAGRMEEARQLYYAAADALLKAAEETGGAMKQTLLQRADSLIALADEIPVAKKIPQTEARTGDRKGGTKTEAAAAEPEWMQIKKPGIYFEDIAGLEEVKAVIRARVTEPRLHPKLYQHFDRKVEGGILLYGPPGTGKTMIAKAIATEMDAPFYAVTCSDITQKYFGDSEKRIRELFEAARKHDHAVIFFDEFDAIASRRGGDSDVTNRVVAEILAQMDGFASEEAKERDVLVLAATNRPWELDSAVMRPPRLSERIYVGLPDAKARAYIVRRAFAAVQCDVEQLDELVAEATEGCNCSDIVALCGKIKDHAIGTAIREGREDGSICMEDVTSALNSFHSSVQKKDLEDIRAWELA